MQKDHQAKALGRKGIGLNDELDDWAFGKTIEAVADIWGDDVLQALGGLPEDSVHCAGLAASALTAAVDNHFNK